MKISNIYLSLFYHQSSIGLKYNPYSLNIQKFSTNRYGIFQIDYLKYSERILNIQQNKLSNKNVNCPYCHGYGFITCDKCEYGCWRCEKTTLQKCLYCKGDGGARLAYNYLPVKK